ncbi:unnamed protein product [Parascedosporium putredinis]|uniref:Dolichyldiphosphatase n=1 Tax=Parascedosporium putredinis TaxID=1442378 RepID=A0A9P1GUL1_9PEZI|nr:unnamed protein product [Parascedosporium putredinis]CAI7987314.1 unnamed protein product [Parascedosporium putredinis]
MSEDAGPLASLSLTHVYYDPTDPVSLLCAWLALVPQALVIVYATLSISTREIEVLLTFAGQLACEAANFLLKRLIKEARPTRIPTGKGYGMPSSHAQFVAFCYHTSKQVLVGSVAGIVCAIGWFLVTLVLRTSGVLDTFLASDLARAFYLRDLVVHEDPCWAGWQRWNIQEQGRTSAKTAASKQKRK